MAPNFKDGEVVIAISGKWIPWAHTVVAYSAFVGALITGLYLHYHKIVENEYYVGGSQLYYEYPSDSAKGISSRVVSFCFCHNR